MTRPRVSIGKRSDKIVGAAGPYPPSPTPTHMRVAKRIANVAAKPEPPLARLHNITAEPMISQREIRSASKPRIGALIDRKSTRLNSSHVRISYAVFCLKKKPLCDPHLRW